MTRGQRLRCSDGREISRRNLVPATGKWPLRGITDWRGGSMVGLKMHLKLPNTSARLPEASNSFFSNEVTPGSNRSKTASQTSAPSYGAPSSPACRRWPTLMDYLVSTSRRRPPQSAMYPAGGRLAHLPAFVGDGLAIALRSADIATRHIRQISSLEAHLGGATPDHNADPIGHHDFAAERSQGGPHRHCPGCRPCADPAATRCTLDTPAHRPHAPRH